MPVTIYESADSHATETQGNWTYQNYQESKFIRDERTHCYIQLPINIPCGSGVLHAKRDFVMSIWQEEGVYCADDIYGLDISEGALTYNELVASIHDTLTFLWDEYATADDSDLNEGAVKLKQCMLKHFVIAKV
jgi:hypothetical protein